MLQLERWAEGDFDADWTRRDAPPRDARGRAARRAAGDARPGRARLLPGRRLPSRLRDDLADAPRVACTSAPFRIRAPRERRQPEPTTATADAATPRCRRRAALRRRRRATSRAGWRCRGRRDTASCRSGYDAGVYDPYLPTFWPARVPEPRPHRGLRRSSWTSRGRGTSASPRSATRASWVRAMATGPGRSRCMQMVDATSGGMGVVEARPGAGQTIPISAAVMFVESLPPVTKGGPRWRARRRRSGGGRDASAPPSAGDASGLGRRSAAREQFLRGFDEASRLRFAIATTFDVAVVGGGPAGAVAAHVLARAGRRVVLIDAPAAARPARSASRCPRWPAICSARSGSPGARRASPAFGNVSARGRRVVSTDFIHDPHGPGRHLDRTRFDADCAKPRRMRARRRSPGVRSATARARGVGAAVGHADVARRA